MLSKRGGLKVQEKGGHTKEPQNNTEVLGIVPIPLSSIAQRDLFTSPSYKYG